MRTLITFTVLMIAKVFSQIFFRQRLRWIGETPEDPWVDHRLVVLLNHTSLFEWLFASFAPPRFLWRVAKHGVIPIADKTLDRPFVGRFFRVLGKHVVSITRRPDESWHQLLARIDPEGMVIILPEGRMRRSSGLDSDGRPMTVRGGVADILDALPEGRMLIAHSGGLHHIQVPGQHLPRLFKTIHLSLENLDIVDYRTGIAGPGGKRTPKQRMKDDLESRKELWAKPFD